METRTEKTSSALGTLLICGFLGAGKTTFIMEQIKNTLGRTAVLVNEFGDLGVDGSLIDSRNGVHVVEVPGGCICCGQQEGLVESIRTIAEQVRPDALLIEPSGIAQASEVIKVLEGGALSDVVRLDAVITIVDSSSFLEFSKPETFGTFFLDQVTNADMIIMNKTDLSSPNELERVSRRVFELNPSALTVEAAFCRMESPLPSGRNRKTVLSLGKFGLGMECFSMVPEQPLSTNRLDQFTSALIEGKFGQVFRGKGILLNPEGGWVNWQIVGKTVSATPLQKEVQPRLTLIGYELDRNGVSQFFAMK
ncbi:MAG: CobW family GTP-binding protein [Syntrophobacter sp.]